MGRSDDAQLLADNGFERHGRGSATARSLGELTMLVVALAREQRHQLRALEAETGISKTTWSAWGRGQRLIGRERLEDVVRRYDPTHLRECWVTGDHH